MQQKKVKIPCSTGFLEFFIVYDIIVDNYVYNLIQDDSCGHELIWKGVRP